MNKLEKFKEKIFIARLHSCDTETFREVYDYYLDRIYRFIYFRVNSQQDSQDLVSQVFLKFWKYIYEERGKIENLNAFLYKTARNIVVDFYRKPKLETEFEEVKNLQNSNSGPSEILRQVDVKRDLEIIEKMVRLLKEEYQEVIILKYIEELSDSEIAHITNKSKVAVRVTLHRALNKLREIIDSQEYGKEKSY